MKVDDKIILLEKYSIGRYDLNLFKCNVNFNKNDIFTINSKKVIGFTSIEYYTLSYKNEKFKYKILPEELISFGKYNKKIERKLKLKEIEKRG